MRQNGPLHRPPVDLPHRHAGKEIQPIQVFGVLLHRQVGGGGDKINDRLKQVAAAVLDKLSHRVQVGGKGHRSREQPLAVLALAFAVQLLQPLAHLGKAGFVAGVNFYGLAPPQQDIAQSGIAVAGVGGKVLIGQLGHRLLGAVQHRINIDPGHGHRQQAHRGQHRIPSAHIIGNDKGLPALPVGQGF